jgi:hypothetical protein
MKHLSDEQLAGWLAGEAEPETRLHLESCPECSAEAVELRDGISRYSIAMRRQAASAQAMLMSRDFAPSKAVAQHRMRWVGAGVLGLLLAGQTVWLVRSRPAAHAPGAGAAVSSQTVGRSASQPVTDSATESATQSANQLSDDELLEAVNNDLSREVPLALAPVSTITTERNRMAASAVAASGNTAKE